MNYKLLIALLCSASAFATAPQEGKLTFEQAKQELAEAVAEVKQSAEKMSQAQGQIDRSAKAAEQIAGKHEQKQQIVAHNKEGQAAQTSYNQAKKEHQAAEAHLDEVISRAGRVGKVVNTGHNEYTLEKPAGKPAPVKMAGPKNSPYSRA